MWYPFCSTTPGRFEGLQSSSSSSKKKPKFFEKYGEELEFEFYAHKMGPFSEHVYEEIRFLQQLKAIKTESMETSSEEDDLTNQIFHITKKGEKIAAELAKQLEPEYDEELASLVEEYNQLNLRELLHYVYTE